jgi:hypothetical protein
MGRNAESAVRTAQMITSPTNRLGVCAGEEGRHSLWSGEALATDGVILSGTVEIFREGVLSAPQ